MCISEQSSARELIPEIVYSGHGSHTIGRGGGAMKPLVNAFLIEIVLEQQQFFPQIIRRSERDLIEILSPYRANQPFQQKDVILGRTAQF